VIEFDQPSAYDAERLTAYILCVDLAAWALDVAYHCDRLGLDPVIVDHGTTYPPSLELLRGCPYPVEWRGKNSPHGFWYKLYRTLPARYVVTDCDLDLSSVPDDAVSVMAGVLDSDPTVAKVALSLEILDLPDTLLAQFARAHELQFWQQQRPDGHFDAMTDTTFALYDHRKPAPRYEAVRLNRPYTARHLPWYLEPGTIPADLAHYLRSVDTTNTHWSRQLLPILEKGG
jgi:hypothetical protein